MSRCDERFVSLAYVFTELQHKVAADMDLLHTASVNSQLTIRNGLEPYSAGEYQLRLNEDQSDTSQSLLHHAITSECSPWHRVGCSVLPLAHIPGLMPVPYRLLSEGAYGRKAGVNSEVDLAPIGRSDAQVSDGLQEPAVVFKLPLLLLRLLLSELYELQVRPN
jgi:hypothetical protein